MLILYLKSIFKQLFSNLICYLFIIIKNTEKYVSFKIFNIIYRLENISNKFSNKVLITHHKVKFLRYILMNYRYKCLPFEKEIGQLF